MVKRSALSSGALSLVAAAIGVGGCFGELAIEGRPCPCGDGYVCCASTSTCVPVESQVCASSPTDVPEVGTHDAAEEIIRRLPVDSDSAVAKDARPIDGGIDSAQAIEERDVSTPVLTSDRDAALDSVPERADEVGESGNDSSAVDASNVVGVDGADAIVATDATDAAEGGAVMDVDTVAHDTWLGVSSSPLAGRQDHAVAWMADGSGRGSIAVWGGRIERDGQIAYVGDGATYDPVDDRWRPMSAIGAPSARGGHVAVWTGSRVIIWGGFALDANEPGGIYDPVMDKWTTLRASGIGPDGDSAFATWTGNQMLLMRRAHGASYDPARDHWDAISSVGAPYAFEGSALWTGTQWIVWGGMPDEGMSPPTNSGAAYDPTTDVWTSLPVEGAPSARFGHSAAWSGREMLIWSGHGNDNTSLLSDGGAYDPATRQWRPILADGSAQARLDHAAVAVGTTMLVWGGLDAAGTLLPRGDRWSPAGWTHMSVEGEPSARIEFTATWMGSAWFVWGGWDGSTLVSSGGRYVP